MKLDINANRWRFLQPERAAKYVSVYASQDAKARKTLAPITTRRQFATAFEILNRMNAGQRGVLLADDVGLGKTTVAALVALVFAGSNSRVRILAPNATMSRRWRQELETHRDPLAAFAKHLDLSRALRRTGDRVRRLRAGTIAVSTHGKARQLSCDLLIIDEAHRTRSEKSNLAAAIKKSSRSIGRILVLTATPFSIDPNDLARLLTRIGGHKATEPMRKLAEMLDDLWRGRRSGSPSALAVELVNATKAAVGAIRPFVIRHGVEDLPEHEQQSFGVVDQDWGACAAEPPPELLEAMLRTDRALALGRKNGAWSKKRTNDPRHHVGSNQLEQDLDQLLSHQDPDDSEHQYAVAHARVAKNLLASNGRHAKIVSTVERVKQIVVEQEKVLVFCDHHATATELATALASDLRWPPPVSSPKPEAWRAAWEAVLGKAHEPEELVGQTLVRFERYLDWLCSHGVQAQVLSWLRKPIARNGRELASVLEAARARASADCESIAEHARQLYRQLTSEEATSTRSILANAHSRGLPGHEAARVAAVCEPGDRDDGYPNVFFPKEPDATLAVFNSPFGPDVLVATDRLSEGIDLHYFCRHLIHHELDPSPVRTVQRNGRIRRVNSWAARTRQPIRISYPALRGTRDEKLVEIMRYRLLQFDLLLGGVRAEIDPDEENASPSTTDEIFAHAKSELRHLRLCLDGVSSK